MARHRSVAGFTGLLATLTLAVFNAAQAIASAERPFIVVENVEVVDVIHGRIEGPRTVLIAQGRIAAIREPGTTGHPPNALTIDGSGKYLMPGLTDMHVHLFNKTGQPPNDWAFPLFVANGVTGVREMNAARVDIPTLAGWRAATARGEMRAPRVVAAGVSISADSEAAMRRQVREASVAGADFVKVFSEVGKAHWRAIMDEAQKLNLPVCGHIPADVSVLEAATAGQRSNEHLSQIYEACSPREKHFIASRQGLRGKELINRRDAQERQVLFDYAPQACLRAISSLAPIGQAQVPTLVLPHFEARTVWSEFRDDPRWRFLRQDEQQRWQRIIEEKTPDPKAAAERWAVSREIVRTLKNAGGRILAGTDAPMPLVYPGFALHKELELLVEVGLTTAEALRTATLWPAEFLGQSETSGSIEVGKRADLVLLDDDPLRQISNTQRIHAVILDGRFLQRADLDALLR